MYSVDIWGCKPGEGDCCWTGEDFQRQVDARQAYHEAIEALEAGRMHMSCVNDGNTWVVLDGPDVHEEHRIRGPIYRANRDEDWNHEIAMQAGMAFGCQGYNDAMGY